VKLENNMLAAIAIVCVTALTVIALQLGYDTAIYTTAVAAIGGLAGYRVGRRRR